MSKRNGENLTCDECHTSFYRCASEFKRHTHAKFCSWRCYRLKVEKTAKASSYRKAGQRHEHRVVAEKSIGRKLYANEVVHHKDGNKRNNKKSNLEVISRSEHTRHHSRELVKTRSRNTKGKFI